MNIWRVPTIDDVAERAGVSIATVSRVINNPELVHAFDPGAGARSHPGIGIRAPQGVRRLAGGASRADRRPDPLLYLPLFLCSVCVVSPASWRTPDMR